MRSRRIAVVVALAVALSSAVPAGQARAAAPSAGSPTEPIGRPRFTVLPAPSGLAAAAARGSVSGSVPNWTGQFSFNGVSYPYTMVGTNPALGSATTTVPVTIVPLKLTFSTGQSLDGAQRVSEVTDSPLFQDATYASGTTQYGDAMQRAEFWNKVQTGSPGYHVRLPAPSVLATKTLKVPAGSGSVTSTPKGDIGFIDLGWLLSKFSLLTAYYSPSSFLIILVKDVYITQSGSCCILGFHLAFQPSPGEPPATVAWSAYISAANFGSPMVHDVYALSHEVAEWMSDPFGTNTVPRWVQPGTNQCFSNLLEVGDPIEALPNPGFAVVTNNHNYHVTDVAGVSWFAHKVPSRELGGAYSYLGLLSTPSTLC